MATITSAGSGNATAGATWSGGVAPGSGDRAAIAAGHTVTVDSAVDWESFEVAGGSSSGCLVIASGGTLTITADSLLGGYYYGSTDRLRVEGGGILQCDPGGGAVKIQTGTASGHRAILRLSGTSNANRATIRRKPSTTGTFSISPPSGVATGMVIAWEWGHVQTLATVYASIHTAVSSASHTIKNTIFEDVDLVDLRYTLDATAAIEDNAWTFADPDATHTFQLWCASTADGALGTSTLKRNKFSTATVLIQDTSGSPTPRTMRGLDCDQNIFEGKVALAAAVTHKRSLFYVRPPQHGTSTHTIGGTNHATDTWNIDGAYFVGAFDGSATGNCHFLGATSDAAVKNVVFDFVGIYGTDNGDAFDLTAGSTKTAKLSHALVLPSTPTDADPRVTSGNIWNLVSGGSMARLELDHCTVFSSRPLSGVGTAHASYSGSDGRTAIRDSLFWGDTGLANPYKALVAFTDVVATEDTMDPAEIVSCAMSEAATYSNTVGGSPTNLKGFSGMYFSVAPTVLDLDSSGGPNFVDSSRSFLRWCREVRGHNSGNVTTDMEAGLADIRDDITLMELSLKPWVEAGYVPRNAALDAATDNVGASKGWIGALEGSAASYKPKIQTQQRLLMGVGL